MSSFMPIAFFPLVTLLCFHFSRVLLQMRMAVPLSRRKRNRHSDCSPAHATLPMGPRLMQIRAPFGRTQGPSLQTQQNCFHELTRSKLWPTDTRSVFQFCLDPNGCPKRMLECCEKMPDAHQHVLNRSSGTQTNKSCSRAAPARRFAPDKWIIAPPALAEPLERPGSATSFETSSMEN